MTNNNFESNALLFEDEFDLREVLAAFRRRWIWVAGGGLLGLLIAAGVSMSRPPEKATKAIRMVVDTAQSPCTWTARKFQIFEVGEVVNIQCSGEFLTTLQVLSALATNEFGSDDSLSAKVQPLKFGGEKDKNLVNSNTQIELLVEVSPGKLDDAKAKLETIKDVFSAQQLDNIGKLSTSAQAGNGWISIEDVPYNNHSKTKSSGSFALGLLGGLVAGSGAALIADRRSNRVFGHSRILSQLGYPLWLTLPTLPWSDPVEGSLIGQLAARLDRSLDWHVLSIAREHEAVQPLAQALIRQNEVGLNCKSVDPLMNAIIRPGSDARPIGLLVVVESGFNSSQALEDARLLLSQLSCVQSIGIVLAGVPLPSELIVGEKASS
ncbi:hypothetical protein [Synechococcus sp. CC9311]|uniref:hypothetical protein n=1 Tax=Synechococcus sp. (strain CC9311) TaxID=64471 RepID=UPI0000DDA9B4|nr:hypothetical protein [Synechococcus sp. CC9311]ABI46678.1 Chain length determinant protein family protein [Synechococcus sp. CC9311]